ncbi:hypothetical protein [Algihabitans albus]|uniref:hypothetical protein n=1 Tax=Algihabitans albus TaxID=2164067 RepID=UPI000E5D2F88|nr:hypothetical protein [Algihabitans albus]
MSDAVSVRHPAVSAAERSASPPRRLFTRYLIAALFLLVVPFLLSYAIFAVTGEWAVRTAYQDVAPVAHATHALVGVLLLVAFPLQALLGLKITGKRSAAQRGSAKRTWHRRQGSFVVALYLAYVATGMVMLWDSSVVGRGVASLASTLQITVLVGASAIYFALAWQAARKGDIALHMDHVLFALIAISNISLGRLVIASFKGLGIEPGAVVLPGGAVGFVSAGEFGAITTIALLAALWLSYAAQRGIVFTQWGKTAALAVLPIFWPIVLVPGLGQ